MQLRRRIIWDGALKTDDKKPAKSKGPTRKTSYQAPQSSPKPVSASAPVQVTATGEVPSGSKNGHKVEFKRKMTEEEKRMIRRWWQRKGGCCDWDTVKAFRTQRLPPEVAIFQVVGFITSLHKKLAKGEIKGIDIARYNAHRESRGQSTITVDLPESVSPKYTVRPRGRAKK